VLAGRPHYTTAPAACRRISFHDREIRAEFAKLCVNVFSRRIPEAPHAVVFYVVPDVTADAADLIKEQTQRGTIELIVPWRRALADAAS